jgi:thioesterase domain-containing protein
VIYFGGGADGYGANIVKGYAEARGGSFYRHYQRRAALREIRQVSASGEPIVIVGHSWGGWSAAQVAAEATLEGIEIDLLITIDPVGRLPKRSIDALERMNALWANISRNWKNEDEKTRGDRIADWGERLGGETQVSKADVNEMSRAHHEDFSKMMDELNAPAMTCQIDHSGEHCE